MKNVKKLIIPVIIIIALVFLYDGDDLGNTKVTFNEEELFRVIL
ncbi:hypothetical protein [Senegalia massiliensis]|nr:hypothetical protein [Senegalia massiliensis]